MQEKNQQAHANTTASDTDSRAHTKHQHAASASPSPINEPSSGQAWLVCLTAGLFFFFAFIQMNMFNALGPRLLTALNLSATQLGNLSANYFYGYVLMLFPAGLLLDRFSVRRTILVTMGICVLSTLLFSFAHNYSQAVYCRLLTGLSASFTFIAAIRLATRWFAPQKLAYVIGCIVTMAMLGGTLAQTPLTLLADHMGWRHMLLVDTALGCALLLIIFIVVRDYPKHYQSNSTHQSQLKLRHAITQVIKNWQNWGAGLYASLMNLPIMLLGAMWGSMYLTQVHHLSRAHASLMVSLLFIGSIIGSPLIGWFSDKIQQRCTLMRIGACISLALVLVLVYAPQLSNGALFALFFALGIVTSAQVLSYPLVAESNHSSIIGAAEGFSAVLIMSGGFLQPLFGYIIQQGWDQRTINQVPVYGAQHYLHAMLIFPAAFAISLLCSLLLREKSKRSAAASQPAPKQAVLS